MERSKPAEVDPNVLYVSYGDVFESEKVQKVKAKVTSDGYEMPFAVNDGPVTLKPTDAELNHDAQMKMLAAKWKEIEALSFPKWGVNSPINYTLKPKPPSSFHPISPNKFVEICKTHFPAGSFDTSPLFPGTQTFCIDYVNSNLEFLQKQNQDWSKYPESFWNCFRHIWAGDTFAHSSWTDFQNHWCRHRFIIMMNALQFYSRWGVVVKKGTMALETFGVEIEANVAEKSAPTWSKEDAYDFFQRINVEELGSRWGLSRPSVDALHGLNVAISHHGFESIEAFWETSFKYIFSGFSTFSWQKAIKKYGEDVSGKPDQLYQDWQYWFAAFQQFCGGSSVSAKFAQSDRKTQKAKGIEKLSNFVHKFVNTTILSNLFLDNATVKKIAAKELSDDEKSNIYIPTPHVQIDTKKHVTFARCCPMLPRHGFTDSVFVEYVSRPNFFTQLASLCQKMLKDDENGELVLMRPCFADFNVVLNDGSITIGPKHDGATGGKGTFTLPISKSFFFPAKEKELIGISPENSVFCEFVGKIDLQNRHAVGAGALGGYTVTERHLTQLRGGPKISFVGDFVPRKVVLDRDFLIPHCKDDGSEYRDTEWEKLIEEVKTKPNWEKYFVLHKGGSISSHFGVHCFINEIPYITSDVKVGKNETLEPNAKKKMTANVDAFRRGFRKSPNLLRLITQKNGVDCLLTALHNFPSFDLSEPKLAEFFGFSCGFAVFLSIATCLGELRYGKRVEFDRIDANTHAEKPSREDVYSRVLLTDFNYAIKKAYRKCPLFGVPAWGGGVGGLKWLECVSAAFELFNASSDFVNHGTKQNLDLVATKLNKVVNVCHNNAKMLTKFGGEFDGAVARPNEIGLRMVPIIFKLLSHDVSELNIDFNSFDLPSQIWNSDEIIKRRKYIQGRKGPVLVNENVTSEESKDICGCESHDCQACTSEPVDGCNCYDCQHDDDLCSCDDKDGDDCDGAHCSCDNCS